MSLKYDICHCPNIEAWFTDADSPKLDPCSKIISSQKLPRNYGSLPRFQLPEPWQGHIDPAPVLFLSSNPSIDNGVTSPDPCWSQSEQQLTNYYDTSFDNPGGWIIDGKYTEGPNGNLHLQRFWSGVKRRAMELLQRDVKPGVDYAITEVVHCKSQREVGVREAIDTCAHLYLRRVISLSAAKVIVVLGQKAQLAVKSELKAELNLAGTPSIQWGLLGPANIEGLSRYVAFLGHPTGSDPKKFEVCINAPGLAALRAFL